MPGRRPERARVPAGRSRGKPGGAPRRAPGPRRQRLATSIQRSPATGAQGGRRSTSNGTPASAAAALAFSEIRTAKGCVASTSTSTCAARDVARQPLGPAEAADTNPSRLGRGLAGPARRATASREGRARASSRAARSRASPVPPRIKTCRWPMRASRGLAPFRLKRKMAGGGRDRRGRRRRPRRDRPAPYQRGRGGVRRRPPPGAGRAADPRRGAALAGSVRHRHRC